MLKFFCVCHKKVWYNNLHDKGSYLYHSFHKFKLINISYNVYSSEGYALKIKWVSLFFRLVWSGFIYCLRLKYPKNMGKYL